MTFPTDGRDTGAQLQAALGDGYAVERQIGAGGFAVVFRVRDLSLKRALAVKVISPDAIATRSALERFRREAETIAQLSHPNIVPLHFIGQKEDLVYLAMQMVEGGTLADRLQREPRLPIADAMRIFTEVGSALGYAHSRGVSHRDVKPHNILLEAGTGRALVTDFGIARTSGESSLTETGIVLGTPAYLAPEQVTGEPVDHRADIFSLGVVAYEMISGRQPFAAATPSASLIKRVGARPTPVESLRGDVPETLGALVGSCLEPDPALRLRDASEIPRILSGEIALARPSRRGRRFAVIAGVAAAMVIIVTYLMSSLAPAIGPDPSSAPEASVDRGMAHVAAGQYPIGVAGGSGQALPARVVQLASFGIDRTEVTVGEYHVFVSTGRAIAPYKPGTDPMLPVSGVTLPEATAFCAWKHPDGGRLPTEEEWEAAARGTSGRKFPWGDQWDPAAAHVNSSAPIAVGSRPRGRTPVGIDDMIGNVWEWTSSPFVAGNTDAYVLRGGGFNSLVSVATASFRARMPPTLDRSFLSATGIRCAMTPRKAPG